MTLFASIWERLILRAESASFGLNRWTGVAQYGDPSRYVNGNRDQLFAICRDVDDDLFRYLTPPDSAGSEPPRKTDEGRGRDGHEIFSFASPLCSGVEENDRVRVHRYRARRRAEGTILFHHPGYRTGLKWIDWFTRPLRERFDVAVMEMPYHLSRAPRGTFSGERLINANPVLLYEGLRQWMADHKALLTILSKETEGERGGAGARPVALVGYSLGAYLSTLYSHLDPRLPVVGICGTNDYSVLVFEGIATKSLRACIEAAGFSREEWSRLTRPLKLHLHASRFPADRFLLISAKFDCAEPFSSIQRFHEVLRPRRLVLLPSGHSTTAVLFRRRIMRETLEFLDELGRCGEARAPQHERRSPDMSDVSTASAGL